MALAFVMFPFPRSEFSSGVRSRGEEFSILVVVLELSALLKITAAWSAPCCQTFGERVPQTLA